METFPTEFLSWSLYSKNRLEKEISSSCHRPDSYIQVNPKNTEQIELTVLNDPHFIWIQTTKKVIVRGSDSHRSTYSIHHSFHSNCIRKH